ncbi:MAG: polysaccharide biosynthesis/export family protein [Candidatus Omnitrophota bacterium]
MKKIVIGLFFLVIGVMAVCAQPSPFVEAIQPADTLQIAVEGQPDLSKTIKVASDGTMRYPYLGVIGIAGLSTSDAAKQIEGLLKQYYFMDVKVTINRSGVAALEAVPAADGEGPVVFYERDIIVEQSSGQVPIYKISPYDTLQISVYGEPDLTATVKVSEDGTVRYALLGEIKVGGLTASDASKKIEGLLKNGYMLNPQVNVLIEDYGKVFIYGEVNQPGSYELKGPLTLVDVVVLAGGLKEEANPSRVKVVRVYRDPGEIRPIKERILDLQKEGRNFYLQPLDKIIVEKYGRIYIVGAVKNPGAFKLERSDLTIGDAINFLAGGAVDNADLSTVSVNRQEAGGKKEYTLNILDNMAADFFLKEEDRIIVTTYQDISIFGQVRKPGNYIYTLGMTVTDAIGTAGGFTDVADTNGVKVIREQEKRKKTIKVPMGYILKTGDKSRDIILQGGDTIVVPESWF